MSYFVIISLPEVPGMRCSLPGGIRAVPVRQTQSYVRDYVERHLVRGMAASFDSLYLLTDDTGDTSSHLVGEVQRQITVEHRPLADTRFGEVLRYARSGDLCVCVWWADEDLILRWFDDQQAFENAFLADLLDSGDVSVAYSPRQR